MLDFNDAPEQRDMGLIDDGTVAVVHMNVRPGSAGEGGWLKRSKAGDSEMLDCEFTVVEGPFAKRKFWTSLVVTGVTEGQHKAGEISGGRLRAILESARGIMPNDKSDAAKAARAVNNWGDFDGLRFVAKIGIQKAEPGSNFKDKNVLESVITPDRKDWAKVEQVMRSATAAASVGATLAPPHAVAPGGGVQKPSWARG
jgi:hypothetical protein